MTLDDYCGMQTDPETVALLREQWKNVNSAGAFTFCATCGHVRSVQLLYCGFWFCFNCAEEHFGETVQQYWEKES